MENIAKYEGELLSKDGIKLFMKKEIGKDRKGVFVLVHGIAEHFGRYNYLSNELVKEGYIVYRYDARGHGKSSGARGDLKKFEYYLDDLDVIIETVKKEKPKLPIFLLGHSMGGLVATAYSCKYPDKIDNLILSAACNQTPNNAKKIKFLPYLLMGKIMYPNNLGDGVCSDKKVIEEYQNDSLVLKKMSFRLLGNAFINGVKYVNNNIANIKCPVLIMHGEKDEIVDKETAKWTFDNLQVKDKKIKIYKDMMHEIFNEVEKDKVIKDTITWSNKHL